MDTSLAIEHTEKSRRRCRYIPPFPIQILLGVTIGAAIGLSLPQSADLLKTAGDVFLNLIKVTIVPLLFPLITLSIANAGGGKALGRLAFRSMTYFIIVTAIVLALGLALANLMGVGRGLAVDQLPAGDTSNVAKSSINFHDFVVHAVPRNVVEAFAENNILGVIVFSLFFGTALLAIGDKAAPVKNVLESISTAMFVVVRMVIRLSPIGVAGFVGWSVAEYGFSVLTTLGELVLCFYIGCLVVLLVVFPIIALIFRVRYFALVRAISDLLLIGFSARSTEAVLAPLIDRLEHCGVDRRVVSFTLPLGYSFNADGSAFYSTFAFVFLINAFDIPMSIMQQVGVALLLWVLTKGIAGVPSASIVVLLAASTAVGLPAHGIAILLAVDFVLDMARAVVNLCGNSLATVVIAKLEGEFEDTIDTAKQRSTESETETPSEATPASPLDPSTPQSPLTVAHTKS